MHNDGFIVRAIVTVIDDRHATSNPARARKCHFEAEVLPGENLFNVLHETMKNAGIGTQEDILRSPMAKRVTEVQQNKD